MFLATACGRRSGTALDAGLASLAPADLVVSMRPIRAIVAGPIRSRSSRQSGRGPRANLAAGAAPSGRRPRRIWRGLRRPG